jgi:EPS-associated MarR family transcriptional regulator
MLEHLLKEESFFIIREIENNPTTTQRVLSDKLGISLGKTNYLLKELIKKGFIKAKNFSTKSGKLGKIHYYLTARGIEEKTHLMWLFLKKKESDYFIIRQEWDKYAVSKTKELAVKL